MRLIRNARSNSEQSTNKNNRIMLDLRRRYKALPSNQYSDTLDLNELFEAEREASNKYRLIFTLNPVMTNVLFNIMTEVVLNDGCAAQRVDGRVKAPTGMVDPDTNDEIEIYGDPNPDRIKMIQNTEYSRNGLGYTYQCGMDIFNNHILRDVSFKSVNMLGSGQSATRKLLFNTIMDNMRYADGEIVRYNKRISVQNEPQMNLEKHLYDYEDILSIDDAINNNLSEQDGWVGFVNGMNIRMRRFDDGVIFGEDPYKEELGINKVINDRNSCDFIDMYPDRTLFSFNPKLNPYRHRLEWNWNYCITYPYKSTRKHELVFGDNVNGLKCQYIIKQTGFNGNPVYLFRMLLPHNLKTEDRFYLYYNGTRIGTPFTVGGTGDLKQKNKKYVFYVNGTDIEEYLGLEENDDLDTFNESLNNSYKFRIRKVVGDFESEYYIRVFRKLPNFKYARENVTEKNVNEITDQLIGEGRTYFANESYPLAFASTIYNDKSSQVTFLDDIDISYLRDNLGRPLHEVFLTIVKNNKGHDLWYEDGMLQPNVEADGCGEISVGSYDSNISNDGGTIRVQIFATDNIGNPITWTAYDENGGQIGSGTDGGYLTITVPSTTGEQNEDGSPAEQYTYTIRASYNGSECAEKTITVTQQGLEPEPNECDDCRPYVHTPANYHSLTSNQQQMTFTLYSSCYKGTPVPWRVRLVDRKTGQLPSWARVTPSNGSGHCCDEWDPCASYNQTAKDNCIAASNESFLLTVDENTSSEPRYLDWYVETTGFCQGSTSDYLMQQGSAAGDTCPKKYVMFENARTVSNFSVDGYHLDEKLNFYCEVGDVEPYFTISPDNLGVSVEMIGNDMCRITVPKNEGKASREISVTVHPNIDEAVVQANSLFLLGNDSVQVVDIQGNKKYSRGVERTPDGEVYSDYDEDDKYIGIEKEKKNDIFQAPKKRRVIGKAEKIECLDAQEAIEYSHCFGKLTSGVKLLQHLTVPKKGMQEFEMNTAESDVCLLHNVESYPTKSSIALEDDITIDGAKKSLVTEDSELGISNVKDLFLGDFVEFNKVDAKETVLESVYHRFNTEQREHVFTEDSTLSKFYWDEFMSDDYDPDGFNVVTTATTYSEQSNIRPEGYYYKPHYQVLVRELSDNVSQDSIMKLSISTIRQDGGFARIVTDQKHHLMTGEMIHLVTLDDKGNDKEDNLVGVYLVEDEYTFKMEYNSPSGGKVMGFGTMASGLASGEMELRRNNPNIPDYAFSLKDGSGRYVWRDINRIGNIENSKLSDKNYPFTNGSFYHHQSIVFFLRRQDPKNTYGLYSGEKFPNDLPGETKPVNNYDFVNEEDSAC